MSDTLPFRQPIERDAAGLRQAIRVLFEESLAQHRLADIFAKCSEEERERILADQPLREISPGYYERASYLIVVAHDLTLGIPMEPGCYTQWDLLGIRAVREARAAFEREHPACGRCGERQDHQHTAKCFSCGQKLRSDR